MSVATVAVPERADVLREALVNAGKALGLTQADLGDVVGRGRTDISRGNIDPASKPGELALLLIRCYRALYVLTGGDAAAMKHWMHTQNHHTGGVPAEQIRTVQGLVGVLEYLDAIRGKL
ncbi:hypothetical protein TK90_2091 [Thioalkalivibrio sp. K90mix]|jgi:hypothetical protein|uniref:MbcA/ParS/Xre antitoxin family protein n=1 Tax=unclassified Thioalkalivibrio TaxID=2621013 RepID=UPI0001959673|nr:MULTISPECIES: MbcA/ParS/Xre antitoxin family protein [unclassified Thioalkalivibrio]ADC72581.1 hypothetical protein TK90_2091 [Thioalkalivibrio sp. K90mix]